MVELREEYRNDEEDEDEEDEEEGRRATLQRGERPTSNAQRSTLRVPSVH